jgi:hypothetical protein
MGVGVLGRQGDPWGVGRQIGGEAGAGVIDKSYNLDFLNPEAAKVG